jgi:hypothetical protein
LFVSPVDGVTTNFGVAAALAPPTLIRPLVKMPVLTMAATATTRIVRVDITLSPHLFGEPNIHRPSPPSHHAWHRSWTSIHWCMNGTKPVPKV